MNSKDLGGSNIFPLEDKYFPSKKIIFWEKNNIFLLGKMNFPRIFSWWGKGRFPQFPHPWTVGTQKIRPRGFLRRRELIVLKTS